MEPGRKLLHYDLTEKLGEGGMGVVWKATDSLLGREVAIKILPQNFAADDDRLARHGPDQRQHHAEHHHQRRPAGREHGHAHRQTHEADQKESPELPLGAQLQFGAFVLDV